MLNIILQQRLLYPPPQIHFPTGGKLVTCHGSKLTNSLGKQKQCELLSRMWSSHAPWNCGKFVSQPVKRKQFLSSVFFSYFWVGGYNKTFNDWPQGKQWLLLSIDLNDPQGKADLEGNIEGLRETKLNVSLGARH